MADALKATLSLQTVKPNVVNAIGADAPRFRAVALMDVHCVQKLIVG